MSSTRAPPPAGAPPPYAFVSRMYRRNLRPLVLLVAAMSAIWTLFSAINSFQDLHIARLEHLPKLAPISIALGVMYLTIFALELYGIFSAFTQRPGLVRIYAYGTALAALLIIGASLLRTIIHFTLKNDLINECTTVATNETITFSYGMWGPTTTERLNPDEAAQWCQKAWSHDSFSEIVTLLILAFLSVVFSSVAFAYYRQLLDPTSPANFLRAPSNQVRMGAYPSHYNAPYSGPDTVPSLGYDYPSTYAPPPGAPPPRDEAFAPPYENESKLPGYGVGVGVDDNKKRSFDVKDDDPFSDSDGPIGRSGRRGEERDVTSPPGLGGPDRFGV